MNKRIKIMCLSVLSLSLLSGTQVQAWPSFKKSAGCAVLAAGITCALWKNRDSVRDSIQEWKNDVLAAGFTYALRKKRDSVKDSIQGWFSEKKDELKSWTRKKVLSVLPFGEDGTSNYVKIRQKRPIVQTLSEKKDSIRDSIQERKNKAQKWVGDRFGECKEKMSDAKESIVQTLAEKKEALQNWAEEKSNNSGLSNFFSRFRRNKTAIDVAKIDNDAEESVKREILSSNATDFDPTCELNVSKN